MFVVFTGLDGSGTSTIAEMISKKDEGSVLLKTPSKEYEDRQIIDKEVRKYSKVGHFLYYLSSTVYMSDYIRSNYDCNEQNVYCVRYLIDTYVSNKVAGLPVELKYNVLGNELLVPDLTVYVHTDEAVRKSRISARGKSELDKVLDETSTRDKFLYEFDLVLDKSKTFYFDNTDCRVEAKVDELYNYIRRIAE